MSSNTEAEKTAATTPDHTVSRREAIFGTRGAPSRIAGALGLGAIPFALAAMARRADAQTASDLLDALQLLLTIEYMEVDLHTKALSATGFVPSSVIQVYAAIRSHDVDHL